MTQLLTGTKHPVAASFMYNGLSRVVDNIDLDDKLELLVGFEMRKGGKFSYKIKKYKVSEMTDFKIIDAPHREGPQIGRPSL